MARKFGKKKEVKIDPLAYNIGLADYLVSVKLLLLKMYVRNLLEKTDI